MIFESLGATDVATTTFGERVLLGLIQAGFALVLLMVTWLVGQRIIAYWDVRKKHQELDIETARQFQQLYGEFKEVTALWIAFYRNEYKGKYQKLAFPEDIRWKLLTRATEAEGGIEAILVKLATERSLSDEDCKNLGAFRQGYQALRQSIRKDAEPKFGQFHDPRYKFFNNLACEVEHILSNRERPKKLDPELDFSR